MKKQNFRKKCIFQGEQAILRFLCTGFNEKYHMLISQEQKALKKPNDYEWLYIVETDIPVWFLSSLGMF